MDKRSDIKMRRINNERLSRYKSRSNNRLQGISHISTCAFRLANLIDISETKKIQVQPSQRFLSLATLSIPTDNTCNPKHTFRPSEYVAVKQISNLDLCLDSSLRLSKLRSIKLLIIPEQKYERKKINLIITAAQVLFAASLILGQVCCNSIEGNKIISRRVPIETSLDTPGYAKFIAGKEIHLRDSLHNIKREVNQSEGVLTTSTEFNEDEFSTSGYDDNDAEDCSGLSVDDSAEAKNISDLQRLVNLQSCIQSKMKEYLSKNTRGGALMFEKLSLTGGCSASLLGLMSGLMRIDSFAFKFMDASAKIPSGMMYGLLSDYGDFDECLSIRSNQNVPIELEAEEGAFSGKYCLMNIRLKYHIELATNTSVPEGIYPNGVLWDDLVRNYWTSKSPKGFQIGVCLPSRCDDDDLNQIYNYVAENYNFKGEVISCQDSLDLRKQHTPDLIQRFIIWTFISILLLTLIGTMVDRYSNNEAKVHLSKDLSDCEHFSQNFYVDATCQSGIKLIKTIILCFSIRKNWRIFFRADNPKVSIGMYTDNRVISDDKMSGVIDGLLQNSCSGISSKADQSTDVSSRNETEPVSNAILGEMVVQDRSVRYDCLSHLSGLRLFVIFLITIGHSFLYPSANNYQYYRSIINMNMTRDSLWFASTNFNLGIDMLLYMSGLVFVYNLSQNSKKTATGLSIYSRHPHGGVLWIIFRKILRFWPTYLTVIALAIVAPLVNDGPMWPEMVSKRIGASCELNWWANLLFINNMLKETEICLPSSWFVSVLMQLFLIGSFIIILERRFSLKFAIGASLTLLVISCFCSFLIAYLNHIQAPVIRMDESFILGMDENIWNLYINICNNLGPFLVGMLGGYNLLHYQRNQAEQAKFCPDLVGKRNMKSRIADRILNGILRRIITALFVFTITLSVLSSAFFQEYTRLWSAIYWSFHRIGWAIVTGYLIHNCATGRWKLLKDILSLSSFIPFSKLIFIAYLIYPIYMHIHSGQIRDGLHITPYNMINIYTTRMVITFATAILIHLLIELPLCSIEEVCLKMCTLKDRKQAQKANESSSKKNYLPTAAPVTILDQTGSPRMISERSNNI